MKVFRECVPRRVGGVPTLAVVVVAVLLGTAGSGVAARQTNAVHAGVRVPQRLVKLSQRSAVHLLARQKGSTAGWNGLCSASKISATELISAKHCFEEYTFPPVPSGAYAENVIGLEPFQYEVASPTNLAQPLLPVIGISVDDVNDVALIAVDPSDPAIPSAARRAWARIPVLNLPLADAPPPAGMPAVVTSFPAVDGKFKKITWTGFFANRRNGGLAKPNRATPEEDNLVYSTAGTTACRPGASGSRLIFANGTLGGPMWTYAPLPAVPRGVIPRSVIARTNGGYAGVCSFSVLTDSILAGLRSGFGPRTPLATARVIPWQLLQGDETPFGIETGPPGLPQASGNLNPAPAQPTIDPTRSWSWSPESWNVTVISDAHQLDELTSYVGGALRQSLENVVPSVDFITQSLLLVQVAAEDPCCDLGIGRIVSRGQVVTVTVRPQVLGGCFNPPTGAVACDAAGFGSVGGFGHFRLIRVPATAIPAKPKLWVVTSQDPLPSDHPVSATVTTGSPDNVAFTSLGISEDGGYDGVPLVTSVLPQFVTQPTVADSSSRFGGWGANQARVTVFSSVREVNRLLGSLGSVTTIGAVGVAASNVDFSRQRLILIQISTAEACCEFLASTLTLTGSAANVEVHPILPGCSDPSGEPCAPAVFAASDIYNQLIAVDRNSFPVPSSFTVTASQTPATNPP